MSNACKYYWKLSVLLWRKVQKFNLSAVIKKKKILESIEMQRKLWCQLNKLNEL